MPVNGKLISFDALPLFRGLDAGAIALLANASRTLSLQPHDLLYRSGDAIRDVHVLLSGTVKRAVALAGGSEKVIELASTPQVLDLGEVFGGAAYACAAEAMSKSTVTAIDVETFRRAVRSDRELAARVIDALARRQCAVEFDAVAHPALLVVRRVLDYLIGLAGNRIGLAGETTVMLKPTKRAVAARIGISPETLSRTLHELSDAGLIVVERGAVHIQNAALAAQGGAGELLAARSPRRAEEAEGAQPKTRRMSPASLINACGRQRMLSQRIAIAWNMVGRKIAPTSARSVLRRASVQFERNLARLHGSAVTDSLSDRLAELDVQWQAFRHALFDVEPSADQASRVFELSEALLQAADRLTSDAESAFSTPAAHRINVAGRNRMLSQWMTKLYLFTGWGAEPAVVRRSLDEAKREFAANLAELRAGAEAVPELRAQLDEVAVHWKKFSDAINTLPSGIAGSRLVRPVLQAGERLLRHVDTTTGLFERLAG